MDLYFELVSKREKHTKWHTKILKTGLPMNLNLLLISKNKSTPEGTHMDLCFNDKNKTNQHTGTFSKKGLQYKPFMQYIFLYCPCIKYENNRYKQTKTNENEQSINNQYILKEFEPT